MTPQERAEAITGTCSELRWAKQALEQLEYFGRHADPTATAAEMVTARAGIQHVYNALIRLTGFVVNIADIVAPGHPQDTAGKVDP